jgi:hypothetical protein
MRNFQGQLSPGSFFGNSLVAKVTTGVQGQLYPHELEVSKGLRPSGESRKWEVRSGSGGLLVSTEAVIWEGCQGEAGASKIVHLRALETVPITG